MPKYLYRFQKCNEDNLKALYNSEIYCSIPSGFADPLDSTLKIDVTKNSVELYKMHNHLTKTTKFYKDFFHEVKSDLDDTQLNFLIECIDKETYSLDVDKFKSYFYKTEYDYYKIEKEVQLLLVILKKTQEEEMKNVFLRSIQTKVFDYAEEYRRKLTICCLTETYKNEAMWESFCDGYKGYCIRFNYNLFQMQDINSLYKVIYEERPVFDITTKYWIDKVDVKQADNYLELFHKQFLYKNPSMAYQKEWRLIRYHDKDRKEGELVKYDIIDGIILGLKMTKENRLKLIDIAKEKNIKIYEQKISSYGNLYYSRIKI